MNGGAGDDLFYVDGADDGFFENFGEGTDTVRTFIDDVVLPQNVENGIIQNTGVGLALFGNSLDNVLTGNKFDDILWGGDRNDTLRGGAGDEPWMAVQGSTPCSADRGTIRIWSTMSGTQSWKSRAKERTQFM